MLEDSNHLSTPPTFEGDLTDALGAVRGGVNTALRALRLSPDEPQEIARRLGISRNLTWKISKVVCSDDVFEATQHLPGEEGLDIFLNALADAGVPLDTVDGLRRTTRLFDRVVERHSGDRATLDLILDGMGAASPSRLEQSRKMAFRGNSGVWGIQARARMTTFIAAPTPGSPETVDLALLGGMFDVRRLRPQITWPIFYPRTYRQDGTVIEGARDEPLDTSLADPRGPMLIGEFCSPNMPEIRVRRARAGHVYEFGPGPVGNTGAFSMVFGMLTRGQLGRFKSPEDSSGESTTQITLPTGVVQFDVMIHRELRFGLPEANIIGRVSVPNGEDDFHEIPIAEQPRELTGRPPLVSSTLIPQYEQMVDLALSRGGWSLGEFAVHRLVVQYPPMHSAVRVRFGLEER